MWTNGVSTRFRNTLSRSHTSIARVDVLRNNVVQTSIEGKTIVDAVGNSVFSLDGTVRCSRSAVRRSLDELQMLDVSGVLSVDDVGDLFAPLQTEVRLYRGVRYYDATPYEQATGADKEYVPIGTFGIMKVNNKYPTIKLTGQDRMARVTAARFVQPWNVKTGSNLGAELRRILLDSLPTALADLDIADTAETTPTLLFDSQDNKGDKAYEMAAAAGWVLYTDPMGTFRVRSDPIPSPDLQVANYQAGLGSMLLDLESELDASDVKNAVATTGESADGTVVASGYAQDDDPASLTYVGRVGTFVEFFSSPLFLNNDMANAGARTYLRSKLGISDTTFITSLVDPTLDVDDVLRIQDPITGRVRYLVADDFPIGLRAAASMPIDCRSVSTVL